MKLSSHRQQVAIIFALTLLAGVGAQTQPRFVTGKNSGKAETQYVEGQVIVKLDDGVKAGEAAAFRSGMNAQVLKRFSSIGAELWQISGESVEAAIARYRRDPRIKYVEPNYRVSLIRQRIERFPNDPRFAQMWGLHNTGQTGGTNDADIDAPEAWDIETGNNVIVGVIDTGVDWLHEDLAANIWTNPGEIPNNGIDDDRNGYIDDVRGWDFVNNDNNPMDDNGHGTHVSGTIAAVGNNGVGTVGVSWSAQIMGLKFLSADGGGTTADAILAVEYATRMGARLTNNSWGGGEFSQALYDAIAAAGRAGILFVAAAGNEPNDNDIIPHYPSSYDLDNIIAVAATDHNDVKAVFSAFGARSVDLGAPGVNILSTVPGNGYDGTFSGTSMATPHVSGAVSLVWSRVPGLPHLQVKDILLQTVDPIPTLQGRTVSGGRLNAFKALVLAEPDSIPPAAVTDLAAIDPKSNFITLTWTASGDDGDSGKAAVYDIRYSTSPIDSANFAAATKVSGAPAPRPAGDSESFTVGGLNFNTTYYFALKVLDEQGNASEASNSPSGTTLGIPTIAVTPDSLADTLLTGAKSNHTLFISNEGQGTLDFSIAITGADSLAVSAQINSFAMNRARLKPEAVEQQESHRTQYEAYKNGASTGLYSPAQPVANSNMLELYRRFLATVADSTVIFHDDMENGVNGWSHYSTHANRIDQWAQTKNRASSGTTSWQVTQHDFEGGDALQSPPIDLTGYEDATLAFKHWHNFDDCNDPTFDPDGGILEVSSDGGARWTQIFPVGGYPYILDNTCSNPLTDYQAYSHDGGNGNAFIPALFDLSAYTGNEVLLRWHAGWDCGNCALNEGWYVDDVTVYSTSFIGWLSANPLIGTVVAGDTMAITVSFDATGLNGGNYAANLAISSNDPNNPSQFIPARLQVIGAPDIALSDTAFDFGTVLLGDTVAAKLTIANPGTDLLTANIVSDNGDYTVTPDLVNLDPKKSQEVLVRFIPSTLGEILGALTITSNDPDEDTLTVDLRGQSVPPPVIAVSPDSLREKLLTGQTAKQVLTITNSGGSDLKFALAIENTAVVIPAPLAKKRAQNLAVEAQNSPASDASRLTPLNPEAPKQWGSHYKTRPANATVTKPRKKNSVQASLPVVIEDPAGDGGLVDVTTVRGLSIGDALQIEMEFATTIVPSDFGGYFSVDTDQNPRTGFPPSFGLPGQDIGAEFEFSFFSLELGVVDLFNLRTGLFVGSYEVEIQPNTLRFSTPLADLGKDDGNMDVTGVLGNAFGPTDWFPDEGHGTIGTGVTWITVVPDSGVVPAGSSVEIDVTFDAIGLKGGDYTADLVVTNNDPKRKKDSVDVHLQVTDAADIAATPDTLNFGEVFIGVKKILEVVVQNQGTVDLLIPNAVTDQPVFTVFPTLAGVDAGETEVFKVRFLPTAAANYAGTLTFTSNDPDEPAYVVTLLGQGVTPPDIGVSPPSFAFNLNAGDSAMAAMTIANTGGSALDFTIRDEEAPRAMPTGGQKLYWTEVFTSTADSVQRSNLDGSGVEKLFTTPNDPLGITIDVQGGRIYWAEFIDGSIRSSRLDGSDDKVLVSGLPGPVDIALDPAGGKMYWTDFNNGTITRANLDGSGVTIIVQSLGAASKNVPGPKDEAPAARTPIVRSDENALALFSPWGIALDLVHGKVYWAEQSGDRIARANLDGSNLETIIASGINGPRGIKLDVAAGKIYFVDSFNDAIKRANLDGGNVETILQFDSDRNTLDLELDLSAKQFYWSDNSAHLIQRANFDGSNVTSIISEPAVPAFEGFFGVGLLSGTNWLTERPINGRIQADSTLGVDLEVNTKGLVDGDYSATVFIASNDPDEPEVPVPVTLHVTGVPVIAVSRDTLDYGAIFIDASVIDTLIVSNVGTALLSVTDISADLPEFKADATTFDLNPNEQRVVVVTFKPGAAQEFSGQLTITSSDSKRPTVAVALLGKGVIPPDIAVAPDSLSESLFTGEISTQALTISNGNGGSDLKFEISIAAARRSAVVKRQRDLSHLQKEISDEILSQTSSYGAAAQTLPKKLGAAAQQPADILLLTTTSVRGSVEQVLNNLGRPYDFLQTDIFTGIDFSPYTTLIVAMDGGFITEESVKALAIAAENGKKLVMLGGTSVDPYYRGIQAYLLSHTGEQGWTVSQTPHLRVTDPTHPLAADLPSTSNFNNFSAAFYMLRVDDPLASTAAINGDNHPILLNKMIGDGTLIYFTNSPYEFYWSNASDFAILQTVISNALEFFGSVGWLSADPISGVVPAGDSINIAVTFDATDLKGGDYFADLVITSNDPDEDSLMVPAHLRVTGAPAIAASPDTLDYGPVFIGATAIDTLTVSSIGTDTLIVNGLVLDNADYSVDTTDTTGLSLPFSMFPGEKQQVLVKFSPSSTGTINGTLTINSNAQNKPAFTIVLRGTGLIPPDIAVSPDSLRADLFTGADTTQFLTITNSSGSDLIWQATPAFASSSTMVSASPIFQSRGITVTEKTVATAPPARPAPQDLFVFGPRQDNFDQHDKSNTSSQTSTSLEEVLKNLNKDFAGVIGAIPNRFDFGEGDFGNSIIDGGNDMYDGGNFLNTSLGGPLDYSSGVIVNSPIFGNRGRYFTLKLPGLFVLAADMEGVNDFVISGDLGADGSGNVDGAILETVLFGTTYQGFVKRIYNAGDPSVNHLIIIEKNPAANHTFTINTNDDFHSAFNLSGTTRLYYLLYAGNNGFYIDNPAALSIMTAFLETLNLIPKWLTVTPDSGRVAPGSSVEVAVKFDAAGLQGGDYKASLLISSNDPDEQTVTVPAHLHVTGKPVIAVSDTMLNFGPVFVGVTAIDTLVVSNTGTDTLEGSFASDNPDFAAKPPAFTLAPEQSLAVDVSFSPSAAGQRNGILTITSNDETARQLQVPLTGEGVEPPVISFTPAAFEFRMHEGDSATAVMTISNAGGSPLNFTIRDEEAPQATAASDQKLYWTESLAAPDTLHRSNLDGNNVESLFTNNGAMRGIAVDEASGRLYWADRGDATIRSSRPDGSDLRVLLSGVDALDLAVDHIGGKIYWTSFGIGVINQANLDGSDVTIIIQRAPGASGTRPEPDEEMAPAPAVRPDESAAILGAPWGIALDLVHGKVYWTEQNGNRIGRANLDGSEVETVVDSVLFPRGIKLDDAGGKIYFIDSFNRAIKRANLDGSQLETIIPFAGSNPLDLEIDVEARQLYWTDNVLSQIFRANFDGSNVQVIVNSNRANAPFGIGLSLGTGWLTETPNRGTIAAGASQDIEIKADAGALTHGNYSADIVIESNDPKNPAMAVPVRLQVLAGDLLIAIADTLHGVPNETVEVPVFLTLNEDSLAVALLDASVKATNQILTFVDFTPGPTVPDASLRVISPAPDSVRLAFLASSGQNITQSGLLATLRFQIVQNAPVGQTALLNFNQLTAADSSARLLSFAADNGRLIVNKAPVLSGRVQYAGTGAVKPAANLTAKLTQNGALVQETKTDASGTYVLANIIPGTGYRAQVGRASGGIGAAITPTDALMALRASLSGAQKLAADVDGNLAVESKDATMIFDFFLGLISQFPVEAWRTFPADYNIDATPDAWKIAPDGIDYPSLRTDMADQNYLAVVRGDVDLDWPPSAAASSQPLARLAGSSSGNSAAPLQFTATNTVIVAGAKTMTWQVRLDGAVLQQGIYAFGGELRYDALALEVTQVRWGKLVPAEGFRLNYRILPAAEKSETETLTGRLRFGGFSTAAAAIREAGVLIEIDAQLHADLTAGASLPIRLSEVSAAVGASPGLSKSNGAGGGFTGATIAVVDGAVQVVAIPTEFALQNNYPNPFNPTTRIQYQLPEAAIVKLEIFNALGQRVRTLMNGEQQPAGYYNLEWNGRSDAEISVPSGVYFYRFEAKGASRQFAKTHKMLMVK